MNTVFEYPGFCFVFNVKKMGQISTVKIYVDFEMRFEFQYYFTPS